MYNSENQEEIPSEEVAVIRRHNFSQRGFKTAVAVLSYGLCLRFLEAISCSFSSIKRFSSKTLSDTNPKIIFQIDCHWKLCVVLFQHIKHKQVSPNWGIWRGMYLKIWKHLHWKIAQIGTTTKYFKAVYIAVLTTWNYFRPEKKGLVLSAVYRKYCKSLKNGVK